jgi:nitrogen regulatory protein P-II 1
MKVARLAMKKIEAIVQPFKLRDIISALQDLGVDGLTVTEVLGHGRQKGHREMYRGAEYRAALLPKTKVELLVSNRESPEIVLALCRAARTGNVGDGKVFIYDVTDAIRISNGQIGEAAL